MVTVRQLARLAGISVRTLHHYDAIGLLKPTRIGDNGYRYYGDEAMLRLQQILFFRELDLSLAEIKTILDQPEFDVVATLNSHRRALGEKIERLTRLIATVDRTIMHLTGEQPMSNSPLFAGFTPEEEEYYTEQARQRYGAERVNESVKRWNSYSPQKKADIMAEGQTIYTGLVDAMPQGASSAAVQALVAQWHQNIRHFYEPTGEILRGLGQLYVNSPDFANRFRQLHPDLPEFLREAITHYCDSLESDGSNG